MTTKRADVLIRGGLLVSGEGISRSDILVQEGKVTELGSDLSGREASRTIDASGNYVLPGGIDSHSHPIFGDKMDTYSMCAAYGGVTTVAAFIGSETHRHEHFNNAWGIRKYNPDIVKGFIEFAEETSYTDFTCHGLITMRDKDELHKVIPELVKLGVCSFKLFMTWNPFVLPTESDYSNLMALPDDQVMMVMHHAAHNGGMVMVHAENGTCKAYLEDHFKGQGLTSPEYYHKAAPSIVEAEAVNRAATMALVTGSPLYPVHLSSAEVVPVLDHYKQKGLPLYGETCPHYLTLTDDMMIDHGYKYKVAPPLRNDPDVAAMWQGVASGSLSTIGSDFTGYTKNLKLTGSLSGTVHGDAEEPDPDKIDIFEVAAGLSTLEFMMPVVWSHGVNTGKITLPRFVQLFCENPAKIFGLWPKKGALQVGSDADVVLWDPARMQTVGQEHGISDLNTFEGMDLVGFPVMTMVRGEVVIDDGKVVGKQGRAKFAARNPDATAYAPHGPKAD